VLLAVLPHQFRDLETAVATHLLMVSRHVRKIGALAATYYLLWPGLRRAGSIACPFPPAVFQANYPRSPFKMRRHAEFLTDIEGAGPPAPAGGIQIIREIMGESS
jgi:hypothetical protein